VIAHLEERQRDLEQAAADVAAEIEALRARSTTVGASSSPAPAGPAPDEASPDEASPGDPAPA
jgi:hypothetical protein